MIRLIRLYRAEDAEIWKVRFSVRKDIYCYFSIIDMKKFSENEILINVHSNVVLEQELTLKIYEEFTSSLSSLVENMLEEVTIRFSQHVDSSPLKEFEIKEDEQMYGSLHEQVEQFKEISTKRSCIQLAEDTSGFKFSKRSLHFLNQGGSN